MDLPTTHYDSAPIPKREDSPAVSRAISEKIATYIFLVTIFLAPLIFIPATYAPLDAVKTVTIAVGILLSCIFCIVYALKRREILIPRGALAYSAIGIIISLLISTFLSSSVMRSLIGQGFEMNTASFLLLMFATLILIVRLSTKNKELMLSTYATLFASFIILALFHSARTIGGADFMSLGILSSLVSTVVGKWYDFTLFAAVSGLIAFFALKFLSVGRGIKTILYSVFGISLVVVFLTNLPAIWSILLIVFLSVGVYEYSSRSSLPLTSRIPYVTLVLCILAIVFTWKGDVIARPVADKIGISPSEVILPWQLTLDVAADTIKESPFFGAGPNRFGYQYLRHKPQGINQTQFWGVEFVSGFGTIPTFIVNQGLVGIIFWLLFFVFLIREGIRLLRSTVDPLKKFSVTSSFFVMSFLWLANLVYTPSHVIFFFTFVFTGMFIALLVSEKRIAFTDLALTKIGRRIAPVLTTLALIFLLVWLAKYLSATAGITYFEKGIKELNTTKDNDKAQAYFKKALASNTSDVYYQALSEVDIIKINTLAQALQNASAQNQNQAPDQKVVQEITALIAEAVGYTKSAVNFDPTNYYNYVSQARISELAATFKVPNAYESAKNSYANAIMVNPSNPSLYLNLARLAVSQNKTDEALQYIGKALDLKSNYLDAVFLLSQIQVSNNQIKDAIISTQFATQINPNEPTLFFQLGILLYNDKNYNDAVTALEKAVALNNQYANARYFLGLSYARIGRNADAIAQFTELAKTNPDNKEVDFILTNLKAGKSPFSDAKPPIDSKPEKRKTLPVTEKSTTTKAKK